MTAAAENWDDVFSGEVLATATAIADRAARSSEVALKITAELQGLPYEAEPAEVQRAAHLGRCAVMLLKVENPDRLVTITEMMDAIRGGIGYQKQADDLSAEFGEAVDVATVREVNHSAVGIFQAEAGVSDEFMRDEFAKQLAACKEVAEEHGVDVASVYSDDELYYEASRRTDSPQESADLSCRLIKSVSESFFTNIALQNIDRIIPADMRDEFTTEEINEMMLEMQLDPELTARADAHAGLHQEVIRQSLFYSFVRTYGLIEIDRLSDEQKDILLPKRPLARVLVDLM